MEVLPNLIFPTKSIQLFHCKDNLLIIGSHATPHIISYNFVDKQCYIIKEGILPNASIIGHSVVDATEYFHRNLENNHICKCDFDVKHFILFVGPSGQEIIHLTYNFANNEIGFIKDITPQLEIMYGHGMKVCIGNGDISNLIFISGGMRHKNRIFIFNLDTLEYERNDNPALPKLYSYNFGEDTSFDYHGMIALENKNEFIVWGYDCCKHLCFNGAIDNSPEKDDTFISTDLKWISNNSDILYWNAFAFVTLYSHIITFGGLYSKDEIYWKSTDEIWVYSIEFNEWTKSSVTLPESTSHSSACVVTDNNATNIHICGGQPYEFELSNGHLVIDANQIIVPDLDRILLYWARNDTIRLNSDVVNLIVLFAGTYRIL